MTIVYDSHDSRFPLRTPKGKAGLLHFHSDIPHVLKCTMSYLILERSCMNWWILEVSLSIINVLVTSDVYKNGVDFPSSTG